MARMNRIQVPAIMLAFIALTVPREASAEAFGECAHQRNLDMKIAACSEASKATSYPWILQWVHRELARAHRERGEIQKALTSYAQSLAAEEREWVRREMEELAVLTN
jgi:hypothetical protein